MEEQRQVIRDQLDELSLQADNESPTNYNTSTGLSILDVSASNNPDADEAADRQSDEMLVEQAQILEAAQARKAELVLEAAARRDALAATLRDIATLEKEQAAAVAAATATATGGGGGQRTMGSSVIIAAREAEDMAGVVGMTDTELEDTILEEETLVRRNAEISEWYRGTVANLEQIGGVRISVRTLPGDGSGGSEGRGEGGLELMVDLGSSGQVMEVTITAVDGSLGSVRLYASQQGNDKVRGGGGAGYACCVGSQLAIQTAYSLPRR